MEPRWFHGFDWRAPLDWALLLGYVALFGAMIFGSW